MIPKKRPAPPPEPCKHPDLVVESLFIAEDLYYGADVYVRGSCCSCGEYTRAQLGTGFAEAEELLLNKYKGRIIKRGE